MSRRIFFPSPFFPSKFQNGTARTLYVRAGGEAGHLAPALREIVAQIDPRVPLLELATLDEKIRSDTRFQGRRVLARAAAVLGIVALLLASLGLYGVTSYSVAMRGGRSRFGWPWVRGPTASSRWSCGRP